MSQLQALVVGAAAKECFLIKDALVQDGGTGPVLTDLASRQQVNDHGDLLCGARNSQSW